MDTGPLPFVGRARELDALTTWAADARNGRGSLVVLSGPAGVGRTRLATRFCDGAVAQGLRSLWSHSWPGDGASPLAPWADIVRGAIGDTDVADLTAGPDGAAAVRALGLVPDLLPVDARPLGTPPPERLALFDATAHLLRRLAGVRPLLVVLDDFDSAGTASLRFLEFLLAQLHEIPMLVVAVWPESVPATLAHHAHSLALPGLEVHEVKAMVEAATGRPHDEAYVAAVHRAAGGKPLLVEELARRPAAGPVTDSDVLADTVADLSAPVRHTLAVAAVLGQYFDAEVLTAAQGEAVGAALAAGEEAGVITSAGDDTGQWAFTHTLWREAASAGLEAADRVDLHRRAARALERAYGNDATAHAAELSGHHLVSAGGDDAPVAARWAEQAGDNALGELAWEDAARHYRRALDALRGADDIRSRLLLAWGHAVLAAGDTDGSRSAYTDAADLARRRDRPDELARAALGLSATLDAFDPSPPDPAALPLLEEALAALGDRHPALWPHVAARLSMALGAVLVGAPSPRDLRLRRRELSDDAVALARRHGDGAALVAALISRCEALVGPAHRRARLDDADEIVRLAGRSGDLEEELVGHRVRLVALLEGGDIDAVDAEVAASASIADRLGQPRLSCFVALWRGMRALMQGRFAECERRNTEATTLGRRAQASGARAWGSASGARAWGSASGARAWGSASGARAWGSASRIDALATVQFFGLRVAQDRLVELEAPARALADRPGDKADSGATLAWLLGLFGRDGEACAELARLAADRFAVVDHDDRWLAALVVLAELAATLDRRPEAKVLYELLTPHARCFAVEAMGSACHGSVSRHLGLLAHALGRWEEADTHFRHGLEDNVTAGAPLLVAHTYAQWSALLRARDLAADWDRGLELLIEAETIYRRLGVDRLADEARQILARSHEPAASERGGAGNAIRREGDGWYLSYGGVEGSVADTLGMHDLAAFVANPGRSFHVADLAAGVFAGGIGQAGQRSPIVPGAAGVGPPAPPPDFDALARSEYRARLAELDAMEATADPVRLSLARVERDFIEDELADPADPADPAGAAATPASDPVERARRAVAARIRLSLDRIDDAHPALGRHLRHSVRTGMFCSYEPEIPTNWAVPGPTAG